MTTYNNKTQDGMDMTTNNNERAKRANMMQPKGATMMYNSELTDSLYQHTYDKSSPSKTSYTFGEYDNFIIMTSDYPKDFGVSRTLFGSWMHLIEEYAVINTITDYMTIKDMLLEHDDYLELTDEQESYAITIFERFLAEIDLTANYLTEYFVTGYFMGQYYEGTADLIELHDDNTFTMIDYKHYSELSESDIEAHKAQCAIYASLYQKMTGVILREIKVLYPMQQHVESEVY